MRAGLLALVLIVVFVASALNLFLGGLWVTGVLVLALLRRQVRHAAWLVLALGLGAGVLAYQGGALAPPPPASYAADELAWLGARLAGLAGGGTGSSTADPAAALRARLHDRRAEELRYSAAELERRAVAAIAANRDLGRLRGRAGAEVTALEEAVRRLALTLTAPEFRDLDARQARVRSWFADLEARLAAARDGAELDAIGRALDPAAIAPISLRPIADDLKRIAAASAAMVRALTAGGGVTVSGTIRLDYDETRGQLVSERRLRFEATAPIRLTRLDVGALRPLADGETATGAQRLLYAVDEATPQPITGMAELAVGDRGAGAGRVTVVDRQEWPIQPAPIGALLRPVRFRSLDTSAVLARRPEFSVRVALGEPAGVEPLLVLEPPVAPLEGIALPRRAFHYATLAGTVTTADQGDVWRPIDAESAGRANSLRVELAPARGLLRNAWFTALRTYVYTPNTVAILGALTLSALASVLARPRPAPPPVPVAGVAGAPRS